MTEMLVRPGAESPEKQDTLSIDETSQERGSWKKILQETVEENKIDEKNEDVKAHLQREEETESETSRVHRTKSPEDRSRSEKKISDLALHVHSHLDTGEVPEMIQTLISRLQAFLEKAVEARKSDGVDPSFKETWFRHLADLKAALEKPSTSVTLGIAGKKLLSLLENISQVKELPREIREWIAHFRQNLERSSREERGKTREAKEEPSFRAFKSSGNSETYGSKESSPITHEKKTIDQSDIQGDKGRGKKDSTPHLEGNVQSGKMPVPGAASRAYSVSTQGIDPRAVIHRLAYQVKAAAGGGQEQVTVKLYPEHLGRVTVHLSREEGAFVARLVVESQAVKELLESKMQDFRDHLNRSELEFQEIQIDLRERNPNRDSSAFRGQKDTEKTQPPVEKIASEEEEGDSFFRSHPHGLLDLVA